MIVEVIIVHPDLHGNVVFSVISRRLVGCRLDLNGQVHGVPSEVGPEGGATPPVTVATVPIVVGHGEVNGRSHVVVHASLQLCQSGVGHLYLLLVELALVDILLLLSKVSGHPPHG